MPDSRFVIEHWEHAGTRSAGDGSGSAPQFFIVKVSGPRGVWPILWHIEVLTNTDFNVLQSPVFYAAKTIVSAESIQRTVGLLARRLQIGGRGVVGCLGLIELLG